jgi:hypothetical protein
MLKFGQEEAHPRDTPSQCVGRMVTDAQTKSGLVGIESVLWTARDQPERLR